jgi:hypothetical protein
MGSRLSSVTPTTHRKAMPSTRNHCTTPEGGFSVTIRYQSSLSSQLLAILTTGYNRTQHSVTRAQSGTHK